MLTYKDFLPHTPVTDAMPKGLAFNFGLNKADVSTGERVPDPQPETNPETTPENE